MYGKIVNGILINAPKPLQVEGLIHYHPSAELYEKMGYLPIVDEPHPITDKENPKHYINSYQERDGQIVQIWTEAELPEVEEAKPTVEDRVQTLENELALTQEAVDFLLMESEV